MKSSQNSKGQIQFNRGRPPLETANATEPKHDGNHLDKMGRKDQKESKDFKERK